MNRVWSSTRWKFAAHIAARHALLSLIIAVLAALWVFKGWYAAPFGEMLGVSTLVAVLIAVDVVCGPLLNLMKPNFPEHFLNSRHYPRHAFKWPQYGNQRMPTNGCKVLNFHCKA